MTRYADQIIQEINHSEERIRQIGADAFRTGDDLAAGMARDAVDALKQLRVKLTGTVGDAQPVNSQTPRPVAQMFPELTTPQRKSSRKGKYPMYEVRNGTLVKIGWSKKKREEYEHKVPIEVYHQTVEVLDRLAKTGRGPFIADTIIEKTNDSGTAVPSYQVYVVIGFLKEYGCLIQEGREGYAIPEDISTKASSAIQELQEVK